ncbi:MAG: bifunctional enoyl-CoA hydratase/phosphate acetyltransferase [Pseudomonadota bacterium]
MSANPFLSKHEPVCPEHLLTLAKQNPPARTAIVRAGSSLPMQAAQEATTQGIMEPVFVGESADIRAEAEKLGWDISRFQIIDTNGEAEAALEGALLGNRGEVDVVMKGNLHTDAFMGALIKKDTGIRTASRLVHIFYITDPVEQKPLIVSDAAVNVTPDMKTRQAAVMAVDDLARRCGIDRPKIAVLSATESAIPSVPSSIEAKELSDWASEHITTSDVYGPLAMDLILSQKSADTKGLGDNPVAGKADAIIVPEIVSGNAIFKSLVYLGGGCAAGIVLGGKLPVLLTSRADPPAARLASAALASIMRA